MTSKQEKQLRPGQVPAVLPTAKSVDAEMAESCANEVPGWDQLSEAERADLIRLARWVNEQNVSPSMAVYQGEAGEVIESKGNSTLFYLRMAEMMGSRSPSLVNQRISELAVYAGKANAPDTGKAISAMLAFVKGVDAKDTAQSALAVQMAATHDAAMYALGQMRGTVHVEQAKMFGTLGAKLLNAYTRQAEVLTKMQRGGEQVVRHVHVDNRGGQAIIAENVHTGGQGVNAKNGERPDEAGATDILGLCAPMPGAQPFGQPVSVSSGEGQEALPHARRGRRIRRAQGQ